MKDNLINDYVKWRSNNVKEYTSPMTGEPCTLVDFMDEHMLVDILGSEYGRG